MSDTNVLSHLEAGDLVITSFWERNVTIVHAKNIALFFRDTGFTKSIVSPGGLVAAESDTSYMGTKVDTCKLGQSSPSTANV